MKTLSDANQILEKSNKLRNCLILNIAIFYFDIIKNKEKAYNLLNKAMDEILLSFKTLGKN